MNIAAVIILGIISMACGLAANYYYKLALQIRDAGAREALAHFLLQKELATLADSNLYGDRIPTGEGIEKAYIDGYTMGFRNIQEEVNVILKGTLKRYEKASKSMGFSAS